MHADGVVKLPLNPSQYLRQGGEGGGSGRGGGSNVPGPWVTLAQVTGVPTACTAQDEHLALLHHHSGHSITGERQH